MTNNVIQGIRFRKIEASNPVEELLRDMMVDVEEAGELAKTAELFALVRYADGTYDMWASETLSALTRIGEIEAIKQHLLHGVPTEEV